ncbi:hypothetical protein LCGC14_2588020 [marine sediment metagenome]|uniref:Uncharacterized protein n=1 Tax=marine sediment metagenome TaxID=412755 RepID=A0A0F9D5A0_9ZZZZ
MALHDPVEDALNARKAAARRVEAGDAFSQDTLDTTNQFLGSSFGPPERQAVGGGSPAGSVVPPAQPPLRQPVGGTTRTLPSQASPTARSRFGGQQADRARRPVAGGTLADRFFALPEPATFARTSQGQQLLQRILGRGRGFR